MVQKSRYLASAKSKNGVEKANKHISFVVIVYIVILIYLITVIYLSLTKERFNSFYAEYGQILKEATFKGIVLRKEEIIQSEEDGTVTYFIPEYTKIRQNAFVCATNQDPELDKVLNDQINKHLSQLNTAMSLTLEDHTILQSRIKDFVIEKHKNEYTYTNTSKKILIGLFKDLSKSAYIKDQALYEQVQKSIETNENDQLSNGVFYRMPYAGVVSYSIDGYEKYTLDNFDYALLEKENEQIDVSENLTVKKGAPLYKIIDNRLVFVVSEVDAYCAKYLEDKNYLTLSFPKHNLKIVVKKVAVESTNNRFYATFEIDRNINEFLQDRFIDIKVVYENYAGIKVPNEAIGKKDLFQVPKSAIYEEKGLFKIQKEILKDNDPNQKEIVPVVVKVYLKDNNFAYIDVMNRESELSLNDIILYTNNTSERVSDLLPFTIVTKKTFDGVFVINKGYTDFRRVNVLYEGDSFSIIEAELAYSVGLYDHVVTEAKGVQEFTTIN
jgi:hypothetical protein